MECSGPKVNISDTVQDIFCPTVENVTKVTVDIDGKAAKGLCSLYLSAECPSGKHGMNCSKNCSVHCAGLYNACSHINGSCAEGCDPGYTGETCEKQCRYLTHICTSMGLGLRPLKGQLKACPVRAPGGSEEWWCVAENTLDDSQGRPPAESSLNI
ncbi:hypothetical protein RRG08_051267 [Elysia crispata]|uniref:Uncharacterized protein n=1 Tax=Elysia crispata TaxID=231223 RepID=A0AAE0Z268_9GAST|nr:hypothetical protein RRG08_051267 [Elysia crispata]